MGVGEAGPSGGEADVEESARRWSLAEQVAEAVAIHASTHTGVTRQVVYGFPPGHRRIGQIHMETQPAENGPGGRNRFNPAQDTQAESPDDLAGDALKGAERGAGCHGGIPERISIRGGR